MLIVWWGTAGTPAVPTLIRAIVVPMPRTSIFSVVSQFVSALASSFQFGEEAAATTDFIVIFKIDLSHDRLQCFLYILTFSQCRHYYCMLRLRSFVFFPRSHRRPAS
jgi:hypothetical protein